MLLFFIELWTSGNGYIQPVLNTMLIFTLCKADDVLIFYQFPFLNFFYMSLSGTLALQASVLLVNKNTAAFDTMHVSSISSQHLVVVFLQPQKKSSCMKTKLVSVTWVCLPSRDVPVKSTVCYCRLKQAVTHFIKALVTFRFRCSGFRSAAWKVNSIMIRPTSCSNFWKWF